MRWVPCTNSAVLTAVHGAVIQDERISCEEVGPRTTLFYSCAGHLPPIVFGDGLAPQIRWEGRSPQLGVVPNEDVPEASIRIDDETTVLLITYGLIERRGVSMEESITDGTRVVQ